MPQVFPHCALSPSQLPVQRIKHSGSYCNHNFFARDDSRIRHASTALLSNATSCQHFATALSQPVALQEIVEPVVPTVQPTAFIAEPILPYHDIPIVQPVLPIFESAIPVVNPVDPLIETAVPYLDPPLVEPVTTYKNFVLYHINPLVSVVEPAVRH